MIFLDLGSQPLANEYLNFIQMNSAFTPESEAYTTGLIIAASCMLWRVNVITNRYLKEKYES